MGRTKQALYDEAQAAWGVIESIIPSCCSLGDAQEKAHTIITNKGLDGYLGETEIDETVQELWVQRLEKIIGGSNGR